MGKIKNIIFSFIKNENIIFIMLCSFGYVNGFGLHRNC